MLKFFLISAIIWFVIIKLLRFKFVVYKGPGNTGYQQKKNREGSITMKPGFKQEIKGKKGENGEYVDYEEVN